MAANRRLFRVLPDQGSPGTPFTEVTQGMHNAEEITKVIALLVVARWPPSASCRPGHSGTHPPGSRWASPTLGPTRALSSAASSPRVPCAHLRQRAAGGRRVGRESVQVVRPLGHSTPKITLDHCAHFMPAQVSAAWPQGTPGWSKIDRGLSPEVPNDRTSSSAEHTAAAHRPAGLRPPADGQALRLRTPSAQVCGDQSRSVQQHLRAG